MPATLRDVAALAGVSVKTASNVLNDRPHIKPTTRAKVEAAMAELGYRPNLSARGLKYGRSGLLMLGVPQIDMPYFAELATRFIQAAGDMGFVMLLEVTRADSGLESAIVGGKLPHRVDGIIMSPLSLTADEIAHRADRTPMVLLGERSIPPSHDHVAVDSVAAARAMTDHLLSLGRRRIAVIGYESALGTASVRLQGYEQALRAAGYRPRPEYTVGVHNYERREGYQAMAHLLDLPEPPDAVFCFNDLMAIGALRACRERGISVPDDIAVAGFDNIAEAEFCAPTLTTVAPDLGVLTREALRLLVGHIRGERDTPERVSVPWHIVVRESTVGTDAAR